MLNIDNQKKSLSFEAIVERFDETELPNVDAVVGIQTGGRIPAILCAYRLKCPLYMLPIHFRDPDNKPEFDEPIIFSEDFRSPPKGQRILLVDDVSVSGKTLETAKEMLGDKYASIQTLVLKGKGDIVLFPEIKNCVAWPWLE